MTPAVTAGLLHDLVTHSHAEGITALGVEAAIEHDDRVLLIAEPGPDFTDETWQLPGGRATRLFRRRAAAVRTLFLPCPFIPLDRLETDIRDRKRTEGFIGRASAMPFPPARESPCGRRVPPRPRRARSSAAACRGERSRR